MNNIRHISIYNEFEVQVANLLLDHYIDLKRNLSVLSLNKSKKYKIKNLSIDLGSNVYNLKNIFFSKNRKPEFPIRFFLDDNPLGNEYKRILNLYPSASIYLNNVLISNPELGNPTSIDVVDSSNVYFDNSKFYNHFQILLTDSSPKPNIALQLVKTETISEYNFYNFSYSRIEESSLKIINSNASNNNISDFYFDSKTFDYLCFSIYPLIFWFPFSTPIEINISFSITVNFDLEELN